jgi:hypothetical protein
MKSFVLFLVVAILGYVPISQAAVPSPIQSGWATSLAQTTRAETGDRVQIETQTAILVRDKRGQDYPNYKQASIQYPQITGLSETASRYSLCQNSTHSSTL